MLAGGRHGVDVERAVPAQGAARATASATASCSTRRSTTACATPGAASSMYEQASAGADELGLAREDSTPGRCARTSARSPPSTRAAWPRRSSPSRSRAAGADGGRHRRGAAARHDARAAGRAAAARPRRPTHTPATRPASTTARRCSSGRGGWAAASGASTPLARIRANGTTANRHDSLARVPATAAQIALERAGLAAADIDLIEINEAFASVALQSSRDLGDRPRARQRQRRRGRARPPGRRLGRAAARHAGLRAAPARRRARPGRDLLRRRAGRRDRARGRRAA